MGQYFKIVNKTKKQVLEPMTFGSGCKHGEIISNADRGSVLQALGHLITTCSGVGVSGMKAQVNSSDTKAHGQVMKS